MQLRHNSLRYVHLCGYKYTSLTLNLGLVHDQLGGALLGPASLIVGFGLFVRGSPTVSTEPSSFFVPCHGDVQFNVFILLAYEGLFLCLTAHLGRNTVYLCVRSAFHFHIFLSF